jgi:hypothetical protein
MAALSTIKNALGFLRKPILHQIGHKRKFVRKKSRKFLRRFGMKRGKKLLKT